MLLLAERSDSSRADLICVGAKTRYKLFSMFSPFVLVCLFLCVLNQCSPKEQVKTSKANLFQDGCLDFMIKV
jgi:small neutral amino acid transporter SnatA (MarC family)